MNRTPPKKLKEDKRNRKQNRHNHPIQAGPEVVQPWQNNFRMPQPSFGPRDFNEHTDPEIFLKQIVPTLISENQLQLASGRLLHEQFSNNMKEITALREWAIIQEAERKDKENGRSSNMMSQPMHQNQNWIGGNPPWINNSMDNRGNLTRFQFM